jgi:hypothetical protein
VATTSGYYWSKIYFINYSQTTKPEAEETKDANVKGVEKSFEFNSYNLNVEAETGSLEETKPCCC